MELHDDAPSATRIPRFAGIVIVGVITAVGQKLIFAEKANDSSPEKPHLFRKPVFETFVISFGTFLVLFVHVIRSALSREKATPFDPPAEIPLPKAVLSSILPSLSLLFSTGFTCAGLVWLPVSTWQILQLSSIFFPVLFSLTDPPRRHRVFGVSLIGVLVGLVLAGLGAVLSLEGSKRRNAGVAIGLAVGGWIIQSCQAPIEDYFFAEASVAPTLIAGIEGAIATVLSGAIWLPVAWKVSSSEDAADTFKMLGGSTMILASVLVLVVFVFLQTWITAGTRARSVARAVSDVVRVTAVWVVALVLAAVKKQLGCDIGEPLSKWSALELVGFLIAAVAIIVNATVAAGRPGESSEILSNQRLLSSPDAS